MSGTFRRAAVFVATTTRPPTEIFPRPSFPFGRGPFAVTAAQGYALAHFDHGGLTAHVISDASPATLEQFARALRGH